MSDTIDRQAAIDAIVNRTVTVDTDAQWLSGHARCELEIIDIINALPSAQPERKTGRWIEDGYSHYKAVCSECGEPCATYVVNTPRDRFCKWCGAKMEGENETD